VSGSRSYTSAFTCRCGHANSNPVVSKTKGGTPVAICDECGLRVSRQLIADVQDRRERERRAAINEWAGWGVDVI
jgi:transcription elongation factor Elf1